jgi:hypothetical protein
MGSIVSFPQRKVQGLWAPLQDLLGFFVPFNVLKNGASVHQNSACDTKQGLSPLASKILSREVRPYPNLTRRLVSSFQAEVPPNAINLARKAPMRLRISREFEPGNATTCAGRMVISGRMADVCDELDRMIRADRTSH